MHRGTIIVYLSHTSQSIVACLARWWFGGRFDGGRVFTNAVLGRGDAVWLVDQPEGKRTHFPFCDVQEIIVITLIPDEPA